MPISHATLRRAALSKSSSHIPATPTADKAQVGHFTPVWAWPHTAATSHGYCTPREFFGRRLLGAPALCFNPYMPAEFHPAVERWFDRTFESPTPAQRAAWPAIAAHRHVLIAAPTGSGKTLAAFLAVIDELVKSGLAAGTLADETFAVYVSPLKALSNDIHQPRGATRRHP
jgi:ATP-dependent helicase YprA (DUF1998 family)